MSHATPVAPRRGLRLVGWALLGLLLLGAFAAATGSLVRDVYSAGGFVRHYLTLLESGNAASALALPGVSPAGVTATDGSEPDAGPPAGEVQGDTAAPDASTFLLRQSVLTGSTLADPEILAEEPTDDGGVAVTARYELAGEEHESVFVVRRTGTTWLVLPSWRFTVSPLTPMTVEVLHQSVFEVNGLQVDNRALLAPGEAAGFSTRGTYLVFTPGDYRLRHDSGLLASSEVSLVATDPAAPVSATLDAQPTPELTEKVAVQVRQYLDDCAAQEVLQPTGCPFGVFIADRIQNPPRWSIAEYPALTIVPGDGEWVVPETGGLARVLVDVRSLFDGTVETVDELEPFVLSLGIRINADGSLAITVR